MKLLRLRENSASVDSSPVWCVRPSNVVTREASLPDHERLYAQSGEAREGLSSESGKMLN